MARCIRPRFNPDKHKTSKLATEPRLSSTGRSWASATDLNLDNARDHRAGTSDHPLQKHAQVQLRVHHIVIHRGFRFGLRHAQFQHSMNHLKRNMSRP